MSLILDAGAFVAVDRRDRFTLALIKSELVAKRCPITHGGVVGQVWRGGAGRQALIAKLLPALESTPLDAALGKRAGVLLGRARTVEVIDAAAVMLAADGDMILTSDKRDLAVLASAAGVHVDLVGV